MLCFGIDLLTVVCADVFCIPDIYVFIVVIFYFFLERALMGLCPSGFQPPMANKYCCCCYVPVCEHCKEKVNRKYCVNIFIAVFTYLTT